MGKIFVLLSFILLISSCNYDSSISIDDNYDDIERLAKISNDESNSIPIRRKSADSMLILLKYKPQSFKKRQSLLKAAHRYFNIKDYESDTILTKKVISESILFSDSISLGRAYLDLGLSYDKLDISDRALFNYLQSDEIYINLKDKEKLAEISHLIAILKFRNHDLISSENKLIRALELFRELKDYGSIAEVYHNLGLISYDLEDFDRAISLFSKSILILKENVPLLDKRLYTMKFNLALVYSDKKKFEKSLSIVDELRNDRQNLRDANLRASLDILYALNLHNLYPNRYDVVPIYKNAIFVMDGIPDSLHSISSRNQFAEFYLENKDYENAKIVATEAYELAKQYKKSNYLVLPSLKNVIKSDPQNAYKNSIEYIRLNDSLQLAERQMRNKFQRIEFDTHELELERDHAIASKGIFINIFGVIALISIVMFLLVYVAMDSVKKRHAKFRKKSDSEVYSMMIGQQSKISQGREMEKSRIARELHDGVLNDLSFVRNSLSMVINDTTIEGTEKREEYLERLRAIEIEIHSMSRDLSGPIFNVQSYRRLINDLVALEQVSSDIKWCIYQDEEIRWKKINRNLKVNLYRILQECVQNIKKHSFASNASIKLEKVDQKLRVQICDNGIGFNKNFKKKGIGLENIYARVNADGGSVDIQTDTEKGVKIILVYSI